MYTKICGRCVDLSDGLISVINSAGVSTHKIVKETPLVAVGDIVEIQGQHVKLLTKNLKRQKATSWTPRILNSRRLKAMEVRRQVEDGIKNFFEKQGFLNVRTPMLVKSPGMETHIRPFRLESGEFIPTSPEFSMKKLLVGGLEKIFQVCPVFRSEPLSTHHHPEFTMLELYRAYAGYEDIMVDFENLVQELTLKITGETFLNFGGNKISVKTPWPRLKVRDLFSDHAGVDLTLADTVSKLSLEVKRLGLTVEPNDTWDDLYFKIWFNFIENNLPKDKAVFVCRYPASQSALSVIDQDSDGSRWAKRFEPYAGGLELGNAFEELTDPVEQRKRFVEDMELRKQIYGAKFPVNPIDEDFMDALEEGMPPAGGIAVGVDRLVMLLADEPDIDYTMWLRSYFASDS